ncbi:MAG: hypothetical protein ACRYG8_26275 [Janthinobacterium lividum]
MAAESTTTLGTRRAVNAPSRRHLIGGSILAALTGAAFAGAIVLPDPGETFPPASSPDAVLLRLCAAAAEVDRQSLVLLDADNDLPFSHPASKAAWAESHRLMETYHSALAEVVRITAHTPEGLRAKAGFLLAHLENDGEDSEIARSLARDVLGRVSA